MTDRERQDRDNLDRAGAIIHDAREILTRKGPRLARLDELLFGDEATRLVADRAKQRRRRSRDVTTTDQRIAASAARREARRLVEADWLVAGPDFDTLHHASLTDSAVERLIHEGCLDGGVLTTCGLRVDRVEIPGLSTRLDAPRCDRCCDAKGCPRGVGSPRNDAECRALWLGSAPTGDDR